MQLKSVLKKMNCTTSTLQADGIKSVRNKKECRILMKKKTRDHFLDGCALL